MPTNELIAIKDLTSCLFFSLSLSLIHDSEWLVNQHRDTFASYIGHHHMLEFFAVAENESKARVKFNFLQVFKKINYSRMYLIK